jgi:DNA-damage-inducible protein J
MPKSKTITVRLDPELKEEVEEIFARLGLTTSQSIVLFYKQVLLHQGLPFDIRLPNDATRRALADAETRRNLAAFDSAEELFADLGI